MALQRRDVRDLNDTERGEYVDAVLKLKKDGTYDRLVQLHLTAMARLTPMADPRTDPGARTRNAAHIGPSFLPWHRWYLVLFERELQRVNPRVTLPYWNWTEEPADPARSRVFTEDFLGGSGDPGAGFRVTTGAFAFDRGRWTLNVDVTNGGRALRRRFGVIEWFDGASGRNGTMTVKLPFRAHLRTALAERAYDAAPWEGGAATDGFRNALEGWARVGENAPPNLHNLVHVYVGGGWVEGRRSLAGTMQHGSSPNDPIFFLHHAFVDKCWAAWQAKQAKAAPGQPHYAPVTGGPAGHNLDDGLFPFEPGRTVRSTLDWKALGYEYVEKSAVPVGRVFGVAKEETRAEDGSPYEGELPPPGVVPSHFLPGHDHAGHVGHDHGHEGHDHGGHDHGHGGHDHGGDDHSGHDHPDHDQSHGGHDHSDHGHGGHDHGHPGHGDASHGHDHGGHERASHGHGHAHPAPARE